MTKTNIFRAVNDPNAVQEILGVHNRRFNRFIEETRGVLEDIRASLTATQDRAQGPQQQPRRHQDPPPHHGDEEESEADADDFVSQVALNMLIQVILWYSLLPMA